ncbi:MAG: glycosyltransferase family 2 protein [Arenicella sp.]|nr:glycosyltransferase family 2 protein [Arenicella sp.]
MNERVLAVVVSYNPQVEALKILLRSLAEQQVPTLVVDNASNNIAEIERLSHTHESEVMLHRQSANSGLGAAHNVGIGLAREKGFSHVLLLDQDSVPLSGMVEELEQAMRLKSALGKVSAVGATYLNADNGAESFFVRFGWLKFQRQYCGNRDADGCIEADFLISSGSLIALEALDHIGLMDEKLFIDHVDTEWFLRARNRGYRAFGVCNAVMQHGLGNTTHQINFGGNKFGRQRNVPQHQPFRYYYIFRNSILLYKRRDASLLWKWNDFQRLIMIALMFGLFRGPRRENAQMMIKGIIDGLRGISGKAF